MNTRRRWIAPRDQSEFRDFLNDLAQEPNQILLRNDVLLRYESFSSHGQKNGPERKKSGLLNFLQRVQEILVGVDCLVLFYRNSATDYRFLNFRRDGVLLDEIGAESFLERKERLVLGTRATTRLPVIDFNHLVQETPQIRDSDAIGDGIEYLSRYMSSVNFQDPDAWNERLFQFLKIHEFRQKPLLVNGEILSNFSAFYDQLVALNTWLKGLSTRKSLQVVRRQMRKSGFEDGWGDSIERIQANTQRLLDLLHAPTNDLLEDFVANMPLPLLSKIVVVSPHGWFAQENVLGRPDTGGQVIYILDQVRALEKQLIAEIERAGLDVKPKVLILTRLIPEADGTTCDVPLERVHGTQNAWILRLPFRDAQGRDLPHWISRFDCWPFLERFALDAVSRLQSEFRGRPDLVIGNYSDGNLVATLISREMDVIQCNIAHALEKTKYLFSDLYWQSMEDKYHFSLQFSADLVAMNQADFIITSSQQEITGTQETVGQYESYRMFSLPGLYRVRNGVCLTTPKFNIIPPGVDQDLYFPFDQTDRRSPQQGRAWRNRLFHDHADDVFGTLAKPDKPPVFSMARLDKIKNMSGLIEAFGLNDTIRSAFNLVIACGTTKLEESRDREERDQITLLHGLIERYGLQGCVRWLPSIPKLETGEVYRVIADQHGVFVQPALFEAFGLTVVEAMASGLPTFGTMFGGPSEIIADGVNGFLMNTSRPALIGRALEAFVKKQKKDPKTWDRVSRGGIERVTERYTWANYSERLCTLTKLYGFWRFSAPRKTRVSLDRYIDLLIHFLIRERARHMQGQH